MALILGFKVGVAGTHFRARADHPACAAFHPVGAGFFNVGRRAWKHPEIEDDQIVIRHIEISQARGPATVGEVSVHPDVPPPAFFGFEVRVALVKRTGSVEVQKARRAKSRAVTAPQFDDVRHHLPRERATSGGGSAIRIVIVTT